MATIRDHVHHSNAGIGEDRSDDTLQDSRDDQNEDNKEHYRFEKDLREDMLEARKEGDTSRVESLREAIQMVKSTIEGQTEIFDTRLLAEDGETEVKDEEILQKLENITTSTAISENMPDPEKDAMQLDTYRLVPTNDSSGEDGLRKEHLPEKSAPRHMLAAFLKHRSLLEMDMLRLQVVEPVSSQGLPPQHEGRRKVGIPYPEDEGDLNQRIGEWQRERVRSRAEDWAAERNYMCIKPEEASRSGCPSGCQSYTMTLLKEEEAGPLSDERLEQLHYLGGMTSGGGRVPNGSAPPDGDYRFGLAYVLDPKEITWITRILPAGRFDGIVDGGCPAIPSPQSEGTYRSQEFQARWAISVGDLFKATTKEEAKSVLEDTGLAKGTARFYKRHVIRERLQDARKDALKLERSLEPEARRQAHHLRTAISRIEHALETEKDVYFLAKGDQVKVTPEGHEPLCRVAVCGTYLRGETQDLEPADPEQEITRVRKENGVAHIWAGKPKWRIKPAQYRVVLNSQVFQTVKPQKIPAVKRHLIASIDEIGQKMNSPAGWARLVSNETHTSYEELVEEGQNGQVGQDRQLLHTALHTNAVQPASSQARERIERGEALPGDATTVPGVIGRLGALVGAQVRNVGLRGFGARGYGYLHATVENSVERCTHLWGTDRCRLYHTDLSHTCDFGPVERRMETPACDDSACALPKRITGLMNADDDGDITMGLSAIVTLPDGQQARIVFLWRYPCVDEPILWALSPKVETPFDPGSEEERDRFKRIIEIFEPQIPEGEDLFDDSITIAEAQGSWRLADVGAKSEVDKDRIRGKAAPGSSFLFARRQADLNRAGPLTRALERFFEIMKMCKAKAENAEDKHVEAKYRRLTREYKRRAARTRVIIEEQLSAFKYRTGGDGDPPGYVTSADPLCLGDDDNVRNNVLPMDYHEALDSIGGVDSSGNDQVSLKRLCKRAERGRFPTGGRFAQMFEDILAGPAQRLIVDRFEEIEFDPELFTGQLEKQLKEWEDGASKGEIKEVNDQSREVLQSVALWRAFWSTFLQRMDQKRQSAKRRGLTQGEIEEWIQEKVSKGRTAIRKTIQALCRDVGREALMSGILQDWKRQLQLPEEYQSFAAGLTLAEDRIGDAFPKANLEYTGRESTSRGVVVYTKGADIPGPFGEKQEGHLAPHEGNLYLVTEDEDVLRVRAADGETMPEVEEAKEITFQRTSRRRCLIRANR